MKNNLVSLTAVAVVAVLVLGGASYYYRPKSEQAPAGTATSTDMVGSEAKTFPLSDVALHATSTDCWLAIEGKVYDVTGFIASVKHPGGAAILDGCGKDASVLFNTRPMGSNTPHSAQARSFLPQFYIGDLK